MGGTMIDRPYLSFSAFSAFSALSALSALSVTSGIARSRTSFQFLRMIQPIRALTRFLFPGAFVILAAVVGRELPQSETLSQVLTAANVSMALGVGGLVGVLLGRMKLTLGFMSLALALSAVGRYPVAQIESLLSLVLAVVFVWMVLAQDRGVRGRWGVMQLLVWFLVAAATRLLIELPESWQPLISGTVGPTQVTGTLIAQSVAASVAVVTYGFRPEPITKSLCWSLLVLPAAGFLGLNLTSAAAVAGVLLAVGWVEKTYRMAYEDDLTGLPSRRALNELLNSISAPFAIAMMDVDRFKKFNDTHGHDAGDQVLKMVAGVIREVDGGGRPFRYGGEEFTIVFPGKTASAAAPFVESVRGEVEESTFTLRGAGRPFRKSSGRKKRGRKKASRKELSVSISGGVAGSDDSGDPEAVLKLADQALYKAKQAGRNRISLA